MKILITRAGGYAGLTDVLFDSDTSELSPAESRRFAELIEATRFFDLPSVVVGNAVGSDLYRYEITVEDGGRRHFVAFIPDDSAATAPLRELLDALTGAGRH